MCGIAGFISSNPKYSGHDIVSSMLDRINYRGPDQRGMKQYGNAVLGVNRLSIISKKKDIIPYEDRAGKYAIVYNGELYNHSDLRKNLQSRKNFRTSSDAETVLYSYIENGIRSFDEFNGMFAFAIYDDIENSVYIVRDKFGEKPVYYTSGLDYFAFSSEMKCLLTLVPPRLNRDALSYKAYESTVGKETLFQDIYTLEPGDYIKITRNNYSVHSYWKIWDHLLEIEDNEKKIVNDLSELIEDAILLRTNNSVYNLAAFISGGVDSALIACIAKPDLLYTAHFDYSDFDELDYAKLVAAKVGKELRIVRPQKEDFLRTSPDIMYHLDSPCTWTSFTLWMLMERAQKDKVKVYLCGDGADECFAGYHRYHLLHHDQQIYKLSAMKQYTYLIDKYYGSPVSRYCRLINRHDNQYDSAVNQHLEESISFYFHKMEHDIIHAMGLNDFYSTMQILLQMADRMSMAFSMENRAPYLDYRVVRYAFSLPSKYKIKNGITKWVLKEVARKFIPAPIVERVDKRGFSAPVNKWFEWELNGKYDRAPYRHRVFEDWKNTFQVQGC